MFTDGVTDQIGGKGRALGKRRLLEMLQSQNEQAMAEQKAQVLWSFHTYQGGQIRRDDITMLGFRLDGPRSGERVGKQTIDTTDLASWREQGASERHYRRWGVDVGAVVRVGDQSFKCVVFDLSPGGARVKLRGPLELDIGTKVELALEGLEEIVSEVRHSQGDVLGLMFLHDSDEQVRLASYMLAQRLGIAHVAAGPRSNSD